LPAWCRPHHGFLPQIAIDKVALTVHGNAIGHRTSGQLHEFADRAVRRHFVDDAITASAVHVSLLINDYAFRLEDTLTENFDLL
jgi:hypothetical protein